MTKEQIIEGIVNYIERMNDGEKAGIHDIFNEIVKSLSEEFDLFMIQEEVEKRCEEKGIICDYSKWDNAIVGLPYDLEFIKKSEKRENENNTEGFKINNNITFEDEETKAEYQKYLDEVNEYNNKIANGEKPEKDLSAITEEFKEKFDFKSTTAKSDMKTTYDLDDLINKIDSKLNISSDNKSIDEQIKEIDERISNIEKQEDTLELVPESIKDFISFDNDGYAFANQKLPIELEIEYDNFIKNYYNNDNNKVVNNIVNKIINLPYDVETTIAQLIDYKPEEAFVSPMTQGIISNAVQKKCESNGIKLIENRDEFGGLAYNYKFKKINADQSFQKNDNVFINYTDMNSNEIKQLINEQFKLLEKNLNDSSNSEEDGLKFWNCKMILRNIMMASNKLITKFSGELSNEENDKYSQIKITIENDEKNWNNLEIVKLTYSKIKGLFSGSFINEESKSFSIKCPKCGSIIEEDYHNIPSNVMKFDTMCSKCGTNIMLKNPNITYD